MQRVNTQGTPSRAARPRKLKGLILAAGLLTAGFAFTKSDSASQATGGGAQSQDNQIVTEPGVHTEKICKTWTTQGDFNEGYLFNLSSTVSSADEDDCIQLNDRVKAWPVIGVANSSRGTLVRIAVDNSLPGFSAGDVIGEYLSCPNTMQANPSRTTVDGQGNIWVSNRAEGGLVGATPKGSVTRIGLIIGGTRGDRLGPIGGPYTFSPNPLGEYLQGPFSYNTCSDRDGDGLIRTSRGYAHVDGKTDYIPTYLQWPNTAAADSYGGVTTAEDEAITAYVRVAGTATRFVSLDKAGNLWTGGTGNSTFQKVDTATATALPLTIFTANAPCSGYGGLVDYNDVLWSAQWGTNLMRYDSITSTQICLPNIPNYGVAIDPKTCNIWVSELGSNVREVDNATGTVIGGPYFHGSTGAQGLTVDNSGNVWVAHALYAGQRTVGRVTASTGVFVGNVNLDANPSNIPVGSANGDGPTGVAVDSNDKVWVTNYNTHNAMRIDPSIGVAGTVDLVVGLGSGANPYNYSDMTGNVLMQAVAPQGSWTVLYDGGAPGTTWDTINWNVVLGPGATATVQVRASDSPVPSGPWTVVSNNSNLAPITGQYIQIQVTLTRPPACVGIVPALLCDLTICRKVQTPCSKITDEKVLCDPSAPGTVNYAFTVTNTSGLDATNILLTPITPGITLTPNVIPTFLPNGGTQTYSVTIGGVTNGQQACFTITLLSKDGETCCTSTVCITPDCHCIQILDESITCDAATGGYSYTFTFQNLTADTLEHLYLFPPAGTTFAPNYFALVPPVLPGGVSGPHTVTISGVKPGPLCFGMTVHNHLLQECCAYNHCIDVPDCGQPTETPTPHPTETPRPTPTPDLPPYNDTVCQAPKLCSGGLNTGSTVWATNDGASSCGNSATSNDVWFRYTPGFSGTATISLCGSDFDTVLSVHRKCDNTLQTEIACNDNSTGPNCAASLQSEITGAVVANTTYYIRIAGANGATGNYVLTLTGPECSPLAKLDAEVVDTNIPAAVDPGATLDASVIIRNTGYFKWDATYTLQATEDTCNLFASAPIPVGPAPPPGRLKEGPFTFSWLLKAPQNPGPCSLQIGMVDPEGSAFGEKLNISVDVRSTPADSRPTGDYDNSGCTDLGDFLTLLDFWQAPFNGGEPLGIADFLNLLDNWQKGPSCP